MPEIDFELLDKIKNKHRKSILVSLYKSPRHYKDFIDLTQLKPGSIYHHLNVLSPLVEKVEHGIYQITLLGIDLVEKYELVDRSDFRAVISNSEINNDQDILFQEKKALVAINFDLELYGVWLGPFRILLGAFTLLVTILLAINGISLAGSAIYVAGSLSVALIFDLVALLIGWLILYITEIILSNHNPENTGKHSLLVRFLSTLPGSILGLSLLILYMVDIVPDPKIYPFIVTISTILGLLFSSTGIHYLYGKSFHISLRIASLPILFDILLGAILLIAPFY